MSTDENARKPNAVSLIAASASPRALRLPSTEVAVLRDTLHRQCPRFVDAALIRFVQQVFAMDEVVESYFWPRLLAPQDNAARTMAPTTLIPFEEARRAALQAQQMAVLQPLSGFGRHLAALASLIYPCGLFLNAHPAFQFPQPGFEPDWAYVRALGFQLLDPALQELRSSHQGIADTLATALGFRLECGVNNELDSRMATAVCLSNVRVRALWSPL